MTDREGIQPPSGEWTCPRCGFMSAHDSAHYCAILGDPTFIKGRAEGLRIAAEIARTTPLMAHSNRNLTMKREGAREIAEAIEAAAAKGRKPWA